MASPTLKEALNIYVWAVVEFDTLRKSELTHPDLYQNGRTAAHVHLVEQFEKARTIIKLHIEKVHFILSWNELYQNQKDTAVWILEDLEYVYNAKITRDLDSDYLRKAAKKLAEVANSYWPRLIASMENVKMPEHQQFLKAA